MIIRIVTISALMLLIPIVQSVGQVPQGWKRQGKGFDITLNKHISYSGKTSVHFFPSADTSNYRFGWLGQFINAGQYLGKRVRLSGYFKSKDLQGYACVFLYVVMSSDEISGDTRGYNRSIFGTLNWTRDEIVIDIPQAAKLIALGMVVSSVNAIASGECPEVWVDNMNFEEVSLDVPLTESRRNQPVNLDFEQ